VNKTAETTEKTRKHSLSTQKISLLLRFHENIKSKQIFHTFCYQEKITRSDDTNDNKILISAYLSTHSSFYSRKNFHFIHSFLYIFPSKSVLMKSKESRRVKNVCIFFFFSFSFSFFNKKKIHDV
jgi:hypothetical protein